MADLRDLVAAAPADESTPNPFTRNTRVVTFGAGDIIVTATVWPGGLTPRIQKQVATLEAAVKRGSETAAEELADLNARLLSALVDEWDLELDNEPVGTDYDTFADMPGDWVNALLKLVGEAMAAAGKALAGK